MRRAVAKYRNVKTMVGALTFDSKLEARRWGELQLLQRAGRVTELKRQVRFPLIVGKVTIGHYVADFTYSEPDGAGPVVEDSKGFWTPLAKWKRKHFEAQYAYMEFREVRAKKTPAPRMELRPLFQERAG